MTESNLIELTLPNHWAAPLINGDDTGLDEQDLASLNEFCDDQLQNLHCLDVKEDSSFVKHHDAMQYCLATDCSTFTFMELNSNYD
tara:strand:+ start:294 stop:551 length:258 start_codon:yes stop_codon:yes gene_type:complete